MRLIRFVAIMLVVGVVILSWPNLTIGKTSFQNFVWNWLRLILVYLSIGLVSLMAEMGNLARVRVKGSGKTIVFKDRKAQVELVALWFVFYIFMVIYND